jgi:hypothetical protein
MMRISKIAQKRPISGVMVLLSISAGASLGIFDYLVHVLALEKHGQQLVSLQLPVHLHHEVALYERSLGGALLSLVVARALNVSHA